jgi:uncharacterized NAD-dependent epimerase/dehydratase family protein
MHAILKSCAVHREGCGEALTEVYTGQPLSRNPCVRNKPVSAGARTLVIGIAPIGGRLPESWHRTLLDALNAGLGIAAGLHQRLGEIAEIAACAARLGRQIHDVRRSDMAFAGGTGERGSGRHFLTVGTDCALVKKYTAVAIAKAIRAKGLKADVVPLVKPGFRFP